MGGRVSVRVVPNMEALLCLQISSSSTVTSRFVVRRLAVVCAACDIPAVRKMCGFAGHSGTMGCSMCKRCFAHKEWVWIIQVLKV